MATGWTCSHCMALCHALLFARTPFSARNAFRWLLLAVWFGWRFGSSKLPWPFHASAAFPLDGPLAPAHLQILSVACGVWVVEQAGHAALGKAGASGVIRLQISKFLRAKVTFDLSM